MSRPLNSLVGRLLIASVLVLPIFLGAVGLFLERSHRASVEAAEAQRLKLQLLTLLAEAEYETTLVMPRTLLETRFNQPNSGLYATVSDERNNRLWVSPSAVALDQKGLRSELPDLQIGEQSFTRDHNLFQLVYKVLWVADTNQEAVLIFTVFETVAPTLAELKAYRRHLVIGLAGVALGLVLCQGIVLMWGLQPLRVLASDIDQLKFGQKSALAGNYPTEVQAVTESLNTLLLSERQRRERVRNTLGDLAHSLKTPLTVLRSADPRAIGFTEVVREQTELMTQIVAHQLRRSIGGGHRLLQTAPVAPIVERLANSLRKVYAEKRMNFSVEVDPRCVFLGDERDLLELLGNLMDNACKYGSARVKVAAATLPDCLEISVDDDGDGIDPELHQAILERGTRADSLRPGQGIGLAVAADIVAQYQGSLHIGVSELGGARVTLRFKV